MRYLVALFLLIGCASAPMGETPMVPQVFELRITGVNSVNVAEDCGDGITRSMQVENTDGELSRLTFINGGEGHYKLFSTVSMTDSTNLWQDLIIMRSMGITKLHIYINSHGGSATDGLALADIIASAISNGFDITTYAVGTVSSAAVVAFAAGNYKISMESAQFMVHEAKIGKYLTYEDADQLKVQQEMLELLKAKYIKILVAGSDLSSTVWADKIKRTTYFTAAEAKDWGLVDEIR